MNRTIAIVVLIGCCACGCDRTSEAECKKEVEQKHSVSQTSDVIAVRIDGRDITRREIVRDGKVFLQLNMNKARQKKIKKREIGVIEKYCRGAVSREIAKAAVTKYLQENKLTVSADVRKQAIKHFEQRYGALSVKLRRMHNLNDLKYMLKDKAFVADAMVEEMAMYQVMTNHVITSKKFEITDEMVRTRVASIADSNRRIAATNTVIFANATNIWRQIVAGTLSFDDAAKRYSEDEYIRFGYEWGSFTLDQLKDEPGVLKLLPSIKNGDITPPIESDGGLAILRKDPDDNNQTYSFSRVFFRLPFFYDEETPEQAREALKEFRRKEAVKNVLGEYIGKLKVEYPNGTNIVWKVTAQDFK